jgi:hypothetical protein
MDEETVSVETLARHYRQYRWVLERESAMRFAGLWSFIGASDLQDGDKETLINIIWGLASLERSLQVLEADAARAEEVMNEGTPAPMLLLSGPYGPKSLEYLLATGLWMDLSEVLTAYRTLQMRLGHLRRSARGGRLPVTPQEIDSQISRLDARRLPELGRRPIRELANNLLHQDWHPTAPGVDFGWVWSGNEGERKVNFTEEGDLRESLFTVIEETVEQIRTLVVRLTTYAGNPPRQQPSS